MSFSVCTYAAVQQTYIFYALALIYAFDAFFGVLILKQVFTFEKVEYENDESDQAYAPLNEK